LCSRLALVVVDEIDSPPHAADKVAFQMTDGSYPSHDGFQELSRPPTHYRLLVGILELRAALASLTQAFSPEGGSPSPVSTCPEVPCLLITASLGRLLLRGISNSCF
jgi:hypothetical protein